MIKYFDKFFNIHKYVLCVQSFVSLHLFKLIIILYLCVIYISFYIFAGYIFECPRYLNFLGTHNNHIFVV